MGNLYATARQMLTDLAARRISAGELLDAHVARHMALHGKLNAIVATDLEHARAAAKSIDDARVSGAALGPLAGLPMTVKDGFDVYGMPATAGNPAWKDRPSDCQDADLVARARRAGAVIWGKSNVPFMLGDFQSYNAIYGTSNNPFDLTRTPGGSSGGAAAALAAGITPLEIGSDIGGSLRHPANFCGVCSLKPTWNVLPNRGHVPPPPGIDGTGTDLNVVGPMARNVGDLKLLWDVLNQKPCSEARPASAGRIALWNAEPGWPLARSVKAATETAADALRPAGLAVETARPPLDSRAMLDDYLDILIQIIAQGFPQSLKDAMARSHDTDLAAVREGRDASGEARYRLRVTADAAAFAAARARRDGHKRIMDGFFAQGFDAVLMPITPVPAFPHDHRDPVNARTLDVDGVAVPYMTALNWIAAATALHLPALTIPAARDGALPIGIQLVGPVGSEDRLFAIAAAAEEALGPFAPPALPL